MACALHACTRRYEVALLPSTHYVPVHAEFVNAVERVAKADEAELQEGSADFEVDHERVISMPSEGTPL